MLDIFSQSVSEPDLASRFTRSARLAVAGLVVPPALAGLASLVGTPFRSGIELATWLVSLAGFAASGWLCAEPAAPTAGPSRSPGWTAAAFFLAGLAVVPAFGNLQRLTGRESPWLMFAVTISAFVAGFSAAGLLAAFAHGESGRRALRAMLFGAASGACGGVLALLPAMWARLGAVFPGASFVQMLVAVVSILGCIIAPYWGIGRAIGDRDRG
jgi:hypothetical protein